MHVYFDKAVETAPRERIEENQLKRFKHLIEVAYKDNPFYRRKFTEHGISPQDIKSLDDITKLPFLYKKELQDDQRERPPFGTNLTGSLEDYVRYHQTTGTTGTPVRWLDTKETWNWRGRCAAMSMCGSGITAKDIIFFPFAFGPHVAYWGIWQGAWEIGALAIAGGGWDTMQRIKSIFENNVTVVACTPTYAIRMAEVAKENGIDLRESSVRTTFHAGEPGALIPSTRNKILEAWGAKPFDYPGMTEVGNYGIHCVAQDTSIHVNEAEFIFELIDPETGNPIKGEGTGEMVLTNLGRTSSPSIRFRTGDIVNVTRGKCSCGRTFLSLDGGIIGRVDGMICLRGMNIFPSQIEAVVGRHLIMGEEFQVVAYTSRGMGELKVMCELLEDRPDDVLSAVQKDLFESAEIRIGVERVARGTIERSDYKSKKFVDMREK
ncbi:MAG: Phenylacetate-coenzyme A ligase [Syntrophorhabdus sp. PtaU1.Bin050]|nr:MAG: Phenylacetate-coenzyme A ligase [Syntrophorhabdus sp. PtaU1.Bin050]